MIYVAVALYCEAKPWILTYSLKKQETSHRFQIFKNDEICLIITKTGKLNAAIAIDDLFHQYPPCSTDLLINNGIAAVCREDMRLNEGYLCNQIIDHDTNHTYYPDILFTHSFIEVSLATYSTPATRKDCTLEKASCIDMEASGIVACASYYLQPHQLIFYKIASDYGSESPMNPDTVSDLVCNKIPELMQYATNIQLMLHKNEMIGLNAKELLLIDQLSHQLSLSVTMSYQLRQLLLYAKLVGHNIATYITTQLQLLSVTPCHTKKEGKIHLERIRNELL